MKFRMVKDAYEMPAPGAYTGSLVRFVDLGWHEDEKFGGAKQNASLTFELADVATQAGQAMTVSQMVWNVTLKKGSSFRATVEALLRRKLDERDDELDIAALLGRACLLQIEHEDKGDRTYAKVANVMPLPAQTKNPPASTALSFFSLEPDEFDAKALTSLPDWQQAWIAKGSRTKSQSTPSPGLRVVTTAAAIDDDIPF
jgi:hypothetical protein